MFFYLKKKGLNEQSRINNWFLDLVWLLPVVAFLPIWAFFKNFFKHLNIWKKSVNI